MTWKGCWTTYRQIKSWFIDSKLNFTSIQVSNFKLMWWFMIWTSSSLPTFSQIQLNLLMKYVKGTAANNFWLDQWDTTPDANLPASVCSSSGLSGQFWEHYSHLKIVLFTTTLWFSRWQCSIYNDTHENCLILQAICASHFCREMANADRSNKQKHGYLFHTWWDKSFRFCHLCKKGQLKVYLQFL